MADVPQSIDLVILAARVERVRAQVAEQRAVAAIVKAIEPVEVLVEGTGRIKPSGA